MVQRLNREDALFRCAAKPEAGPLHAVGVAGGSAGTRAAQACRAEMNSNY